MAAVSTDPPNSAETPIKKDNFIESMEDEVRRCAEHLERRQSKKKAFSSLDRTTNGYSASTSSSYSGEFRSRKGNLSMRSTLPRSFNIPSESEDRAILSPRIIPPAVRSPRLSPERTFKFGGVEDLFSGHYKREETNLSPSSFLRGNSAPPEPYAYYGAGSGSRENSLTPLQSPLCRTPIGAVASHSRQSSLSSSSPPPVPPKPSKSRSKRDKSHTPPSPHRSQILHKVEVSSFSKDAALMKDPLPPPLRVEATTTTADVVLMKDPLPPPLLVAATTTIGSGPDHGMEFPSAEIDLQDTMLKKTSNLNGSTTTTTRVESSVDREEHSPAPPTLPPKDGSAPPTLPPKDESGPPTLPPKKRLAPLKIGPNPTTSSTPPSASEIDGDPFNLLHPVTRNPPREGAHSKEVLPLAPEEQTGTVSLTDVDPSGDPLASGDSMDIHLACSNNEEEEEDEESISHGSREEVGSKRAVQEMEVEVDELLEELSENTDFLSPSDSKSGGGSPSSEGGGDNAPPHHILKTRRDIRPLSMDDSDILIKPEESLIAIRGTKPIETGGDILVDKVEEMFILPSLKTPPEMMMSAQDLEVTLPEVKSIPMHSHASRSNVKRGYKEGNRRLSSDGHSFKSRKKNDSEANSSNITTVSSTDNSLPLSDKPCLFSELTSLDGGSESVALIVKELQIRLKEKEEDIARLQRQNERQLKEKDERIKKLHKESKKMEREKWELLKRARDAAERSLHLRTQLDIKEGSLLSAQGELERARDKLVSVKSANTSLRALLTDLKANRAKKDVQVEDIGIQVDIPDGTLRRNRSIELAFAQGEQNQEPENNLERTSDHRISTSSLGLNWPEKWDSMDTTSLHDDFRELGPSSQPLGSRESRRSKKKGAFLTKIMRSSGRRGSKTSVASMDGLNISQTSLVSGGGRVPNNTGGFIQVGSSTDLREQRRILEEGRDVPFTKWDFRLIMAWMEAEMGMGVYSRLVAEKCPSGVSLLSLSEADMDKKLGISNALHRRKLLLALQEKKDPDMVQYPLASQIDHNWVAFEWAHDCGLAHLTETLSHHLVDGRTLNSLTKEDLKKYFKMIKKTDQLSFLSGVELLRVHDYDREAIQEHRRTSNNPLYWTNRDMQDWLRQIDLQDYATNVIGGGIHGALLFFDDIGRFTSDQLASIIQIPASKTQLRRHLGGKMASLFNEDIGSYMDHLPSHSTPRTYSPLNLSPSNKSGSQSPHHTPHHSPVKHRHSTPTGQTPSGHISPNCIHPSRKNSLGRKAMASIGSSLTHLPPTSPPGFQRTGSARGGASMSPQHFQRNSLEKAEKARLSLRESALRSTREEGQFTKRSVTPTTQLSSTTV